MQFTFVDYQMTKVVTIVVLTRIFSGNALFFREAMLFFGLQQTHMFTLQKISRTICKVNLRKVSRFSHFLCKFLTSIHTYECLHVRSGVRLAWGHLPPQLISSAVSGVFILRQTKTNWISDYLQVLLTWYNTANLFKIRMVKSGQPIGYFHKHFW